ncbi:IS3 family transposase [Flavobacterium sp. ACN6]|uniref:IS3 family transposase n=1 Tax=Flavobacterium sp. ACN6 TaxID=1920426 RepID=UPI0015565AF4|nr:IS3 family transposase [Flavobacterium sp. ACN6]
MINMKRVNNVYDPYFKVNAVLVSYKRNNLTKLEQELGLYEGAMTSWRKVYKKYGPEGFSKNNSLKKNKENHKESQFEKKIKKSELDFELLQEAGEHLKDGKPRIFQFMKDNEKRYSIRNMCKVLGINRNTYRRWKNNYDTEQKRKEAVQKEITAIFFEAKQRYGKQRIKIALQNSGYHLAVKTVGKYMRELGLHCK